MSDMTLSEAAAECSKFATTMRAFSRAQEVIDFAVSQDQLTKERQAQLDKLYADIEAAKAELATARDAADQVGANNAQSVAVASENAGAILQKARDDADALLAAAQAQVKDAHDAAAQAGLDASASIAARDAADAQLSELNARIAAARAQAKALIGDAP